jgi:hypothetical protein
MPYALSKPVTFDREALVLLFTENPVKTLPAAVAFERVNFSAPLAMTRRRSFARRRS